jgi:predicted CxxxxCH...CXXCH cytochrome family protein
MNKNIQLFCAIITGAAMALVMAQCSQLQKDLPTQPKYPTVPAHPAEWLNPEAAEFHGNYIRQHEWDLTACQTCHGKDYAGGTSKSSCNTCHTQTPEGCTTCHGGADNQTGAPPKDLQGNKATTFKGVGAHTVHLTGGAVSNGFACTECHKKVENFSDPTHIGSELLPAEIVWGELATEDDAAPSWDGVQTCQSVYCHGEFKFGNKNNDPSWIKVDGSQAACGSCHGLPPGSPHPAESRCVSCHSKVVNASLEIIDKDKHINGKKD